MSRAVYRFVEFTITQDSTACPEFSAICVSGDEEDCGASSGFLNSMDDVTEWMRKHAQDNQGHWRYERTCTDYAVMEPPEGLNLQPVTEYPRAHPCNV